MKRVPKKSLIIVVAIFAFIALFYFGLPRLFEKVAYSAEAGEAMAAREELKYARNLSEAFKFTAKAVRPSVVNISSVKRFQAVGGMDPNKEMLPEGHPYKDFFDFFSRKRPPGKGYEQRGLGTGVIVSEDGYILTNNHVVSQADEVTVKLSTGKTYEAKILGTDPKTDLALLKIEAQELMPAQFGDSDKIEVGEWVLAIGNPFGLEQTVTSGIVSAKGRSNVGVAEYEDFIQTDAPINPGNSGGPLVDLEGKVIGINTAIATRTGGYQGIGFSIPINIARSIMERLITTGRVDRGWLGVWIQDLNEELADSFGFDGTEGALIGDVVRGGPADKAGMKSGDIVVRYDGNSVQDSNKFRNMVAATAPEKDVSIDIYRNGKKQTLAVKIGLLEGEAPAIQEEDSSAKLGITVQTLTKDLAKKLSIEFAEGVLVKTVQSGGMAERAGIRIKDVILSVNGESVKDGNAFNRIIEKANIANGIRMRVMTEGSTRFLFLKNN